MKPIFIARRRGLSLVEVVIASALLSLIVGAAYMVLAKGMSYVRTNNRALDAQRAAMNIIAKVSFHISSSRRGLVEPGVSGVVITSPFKADGRVSIDAASADLFWQKYIGIFRSQEDVLMREEAITPTVSAAPPGTVGKTVGYFSGLGTTSKRLGADISYFEVTALPSATGEQAKFQIVVTAGDMQPGSSYGVNVTSIVSTRN